MRRITRLSVLGLAATATMSACSPEQVIETPSVPTAGVRFINALPDSAGAFGLDFRFVDLVENSTQFRVAFRNTPDHERRRHGVHRRSVQAGPGGQPALRDLPG